MSQNRETNNNAEVADDLGRTEEEAVSILRNLRDHGFASSNEQLATALGRSPHHVADSSEKIDDDLVRGE